MCVRARVWVVCVCMWKSFLNHGRGLRVSLDFGHVSPSHNNKHGDVYDARTTSKARLRDAEGECVFSKAFRFRFDVARSAPVLPFNSNTLPTAPSLLPPYRPARPPLVCVYNIKIPLKSPQALFIYIYIYNTHLFYLFSMNIIVHECWPSPLRPFFRVN